ncbi:VOC family protein [Pseudoroseicyclus sp. CXY001]|uniref:VOC family protein n=1 Tax=Pseudoroseicyclus sp. CXY001 TaxID=3242492 RepID=UPI003570DEED
MDLGAFSVSLAVNDLAKSRAFYEALGFAGIGGDGEHYLILKNGAATIGLFQGMFEGNILTFNPGWTADGAEADPFTDIRDIQARLKAAGIELTQETDPDGTGTGHVALTDPDGNAILIDQHRAKG